MRLKTIRDARARHSKTDVGTRGFTLLEVLLAVFVFAVSILTMISTLTFTMRAVNQNRQALFAKTAVNAQLEHERAVVTASNAASNTAFDNLVPGTHTFAIDDLPGVTGSVDVDDIATDLKRITVTVPLDSARIWRLATLVTKNLAGGGSDQYPPGGYAAP